MITTLLCCLSLIGCGNNDGLKAELHPAMNMSVSSFTSTSVTLDIKKVNASHVRLLCLAGADPSSQTATDVATDGTKYTEAAVTVDGLTPDTDYTVFAIPCDDSGKHGNVQYVQFTTDNGQSEIYPWEAERDGLLSFTDMVLCYGGSAHRVPNKWDSQRFEPFVTYVDEEDNEHWLFDSFLCLEFVTTRSNADGQRYSYAPGYEGAAAGKAQWQEQIDYWFGAGNGVNALEAAVGDAANRLGNPPSKRKVIISMPEPVIYKLWSDTKSATDYWGELDGRRLNFADGNDRVAACKWFINQVRKKFDDGNYKYVDLAGFYIISEELVSTDDGWNPELKKSWQLFPAVADYLHSLNEALCWIPYNRAAGYSRWKQFGVDYTYMQPNYFWNGNTKPIPQFFADIKANDLAMEFEFDGALLAGQPDSNMYKDRLRAYMAGAISNGIYGTQPLSYYQGENTLYDLWKSQNASDREMYHEFCLFVLGNPLRK